MMTTNQTPSTETVNATKSMAMQKVVIVNGSTDMPTLLETVLEAGHYDLVFVESSDHAYSQIKRLQPHLIILCMRFEDDDGFQVLSMLNMDDETRRIPVITYTTEYDGEEAEQEAPDTSEMEIFPASKPALPMN